MPRGNTVDVLQMGEKGIFGSKAQAVGEAEERVFDNDNRRADTKGKGSKDPSEATVVRKKSSLSKPMEKAAPMAKYLPLGKAAEFPEVPPMKAVPSKALSKVTEVPPVKTVPPEVSSKVTVVSPRMASMTSPMAAESPSIFSWYNNHKEGRDPDNDKLFHIPLLRCTRGDNPWRFEVSGPLVPRPPANIHGIFLGGSWPEPCV